MMGRVDIELFEEEKVVTVPEQELTTAKRQIEATVALLQKVQDVPTAEEVGLVRSTAELVLKQAMAMTVVDQVSYERACDLGKRCVLAIKAIDDNKKLEEGRSAADTLHKWFTSLIGSMKNPYKQAKAEVDKKANIWLADERKRIAAEDAKKEKEAKQKAEEEKLALAGKLEAVEDFVARDRVLETPVDVAPVKTAAPVGVAGRSVQQNWKAEVTDFKVLVAAIVKGGDGAPPWSFIEPVESAMNASARALKAEWNYPGSRAYDAGKTRYSV
jgi:hypothetical protein